MNPDRKYVAISVKHTDSRWKFGMPCVLWGDMRPSADDERRRFGGYTMYLDRAERYAKDDFFTLGGYKTEYGVINPEPVKMCIGFRRKYKKWDTVLVEYDNYATYCKAASIPTQLEAEK